MKTYYFATGCLDYKGHDSGSIYFASTNGKDFLNADCWNPLTADEWADIEESTKNRTPYERGWYSRSEIVDEYGAEIEEVQVDDGGTS